MTPEQAASKIEKAISAQALFGSDPKDTYRRLSMLCHPDQPANIKTLGQARAEKVFAKLSSLYASLNGKTAPVSPTVLGDWVVEAPLAKGDIADLYRVTSVSAKVPVAAVLKIARSPVDNDLMEAEAAALQALRADTLSDNFKKYINVWIQTFRASGRQANVLSLAEGYYSLADIAAMYPSGFDFRHTVWMGNRLLSALGFAHRNGRVHGAILPQHLLFHPETHGLVLVDWCYSVEIGKPILARVKSHLANYPPEVARKLPATPATDIYMAAKAIFGTRAQIPKRFKALFEHCLAESPNARPQDAWDLQDKWVKIAEQEFGKAKYLKLEIPVV